MVDPEILFGVSGSVPSCGFSVLPTPLHLLPVLTDLYGTRLWCKRDDMTGFAFGGNKSRKLDYLIRDAMERGCDSIVTFGSVQSNWCRIASAAAAVKGLDAYLILSGSEPVVPGGNLLLDRLVGASVEFTESEKESEILDLCSRQIEKLRNDGGNPYFMAVGGSDNIGSTGYIKAMGEIISYGNERGVDFSRIFVASGSAGTQAGLVAGKLISGWQGDITGVSVARQAVEQREKVSAIAAALLRFHNYEFAREEVEKAVIVDDNYLGAGYRVNTPECEEAVTRFARSEGVFLDYVYTGKAAAALLDYSARGAFAREEDTLFIHTGGAIQLFE
ncbi:MAG: D-cysteine desulfhydrase family protein [Bacteroidales bacterium]|nr:D-cysteine desulfhydrase family protein [Bacteroidales bacterium]